MTRNQDQHFPSTALTIPQQLAFLASNFESTMDACVGSGRVKDALQLQLHGSPGLAVQVLKFVMKENLELEA
jgi:hypothetical protein